MSSCMSFPLLVAIPLLCVLFGLFWLWLCVFWFVCVLLFLVWFVFDGIANWTLYWSITSAFEAIDELTALHANLQFIFFAAVERV